MKNQEQFNRFLSRHPHSHKFFFERPHISRRDLFQWLGAGVTGAALANPARATEVVSTAGVQPINKAENVIFILCSGAMSHVDTFDFKMTPDTPAGLVKAEVINGLAWPSGLMPKLGQSLGDLAIVRSVRSWALQHNLAQTWAQIGRNPTAALGDIAPNTGSIVAIEKQKERLASHVFPIFLGLNAGDMIGSGYLSSQYAPLKIAPSTAGLPDTNNADGQTRFENKYALMKALDAPLRAPSVDNVAFSDFGAFYESGKAMMFNPAVNDAFRFTAEESALYGSTGFGNACLIAQKVLRAGGGTRYIQIHFGGWDHHQDIYDTTANNRLPALTKQLDDGLSRMLADLKASGVLDKTLIVMMSEFGRTVGPITSQDGRDHFLQQFAVFAGAGIKGGRALGSTNADGSATATHAWTQDRDVRPEDIEATIYSALGIDWTTIRYDDPFGRGFEYVPFAKDGLYAPLHELWA
ncbi:MAG TPA: DUF1501 domain-containing protein [Bryobacteraceae bacterium]|nr:DUF1501 domain-containing protein [Bryobacteraceae bacterium]